MKITIEEINGGNIADAGKCDNEFVIEAKLVVQVKDGEIGYTISPLPAYRKRYDQDILDFTPYIRNPDQVVYLAYVDGQITGRVILRKYWNNYAYLDDITVDSSWRRRGIGKALIEQAKRWAEERHLAGIMLETQDNNVGACKFYESCGFHLQGFDRHLYRGLDKWSDEVALYWYFDFTAEVSDG